jgi:hypothetical protein
MTALRERPTSAPAREETEIREVRAADPSLSPYTNERLTIELREVLGTDQVRVPASRPHASRGERPHGHTLASYLSMNWLSMLFGLAIWVTVGGVIALTTGDWWFLPLAAGIHALGTTAVILTSVRLTTISEHPSPTLSAAMTGDGVRSPDERFSEMVEEFRLGPEGTVSQVLSAGYDERPTPTLEDPGRAGAEQAAAMTPTSGPSHTVSAPSAPDYVIWSITAGLGLFSIAIPAAFGGGWMWLTTAVMLPIVAGIGFYEWMMVRRPQWAQVHTARPMIVTVLGTVVAVAIFCAIVALAYHGIHWRH